MNRRRLVACLCTFAALGLIAPDIARATTWRFIQTGWGASANETGGIVTGSFSGKDGDGDGVLELSEVSRYLMRFQGFKYGDSFEIGHLRAFRYIIGSDGFPPSGPHYGDNGWWDYDAVAGEIILSGLSAGSPPMVWITTHEPARISEVPLPAGAGLALTALGALIACGARARRRCI